jgi:hypothetical protein
MVLSANAISDTANFEWQYPLYPCSIGKVKESELKSLKKQCGTTGAKSPKNEPKSKAICANDGVREEVSN